jgi:hypothetical protein
MVKEMRVLLLSLLVLLTWAASAAAQTDCVAPPGTAAIEQYCEAVPAPTGDRSGGASDPRPLAPAARQQLAQQGPDGAALAQVLTGDNASAVSPGGSDGTSGSSGTSGTSGGRSGSAGENEVKGDFESRDAPSSNPLEAVSTAVTSGPTLGGLFGWALIAAAMLAAGAFWLRFRGRRD